MKYALIAMAIFLFGCNAQSPVSPKQKVLKERIVRYEHGIDSLVLYGTDTFNERGEIATEGLWQQTFPGDTFRWDVSPDWRTYSGKDTIADTLWDYSRSSYWSIIIKTFQNRQMFKAEKKYPDKTKNYSLFFEYDESGNVTKETIVYGLNSVKMYGHDNKLITKFVMQNIFW